MHGVETVLRTFHFDEQRLIGFHSNLRNCVDLEEEKTIFMGTFKE